LGGLTLIRQWRSFAYATVGAARVIIVETPTFTRRVSEFLDAEAYRLLQLELAENPNRAPVIPRSGGLRKIRWQRPGRGKRGGARVIYYWAQSADVILLLLVYSKSEQDDLTREQLRTLRRLVEEEFK
jgi:mRNA-degrading endonuclease RelE of RelBE toxin-antitoxin system